MGRIEYSHVLSQTGGASYGLARTAENDLLMVDAEAFEKDANPAEYSLEAIIAHECGHQLIARHERLKRIMPASWNESAEEILASLVGSVLVDSKADEETLVLKAMFESVKLGNDLTAVQDHFSEIRELLRNLI
ncbi:MAG TPA: hypothetical protein VGI99_06780 [Gemmataceae bacterium]